MKSRVNKKILFEIYNGLLLFLIFILIIAVLYCSSAWFMISREVKAEEMAASATIEEKIEIVDLNVIKYDEETKAPHMYHETDFTSLEYVDMNSYDTVFEERQEFTPMILVIDLKNTKGRPFSVNLKCTGGLLQENKLDNNLSNILKFKCVYSAALDSLKTSVEDLYFDSKSFFEDDDNRSEDVVSEDSFQERGFVTVENNALGTKNSEISFDIGEHLTAADETFTIYLYVNYDNALINRYIEDYFGAGSVRTDFFLDSNIIEFQKDLDMIDFTEEDE